jgi:diadenosine tetraphosphate (Ap4A) HIT family hydrolase
MLGNNLLLWEDDHFMIKTPLNPHIPYSEGLHLIVTSKIAFESAWADPDKAAQAFTIAAKACKMIEDEGLAPWFNIQSNGNWGLLSDGKKFFHIHIYGRNQTSRWGKPITLPELPGTYSNEPMPESDQNILIEAFKHLSY